MAPFDTLIWTITIILVLKSIGSCIACGRAEYRIGDECCPMCSQGNRVHSHCTEFTSTSCAPCVDSTFLDEPNGLIKCKVCTNCDPGLGLKVKQPCRPSSDTVCGTLEGFYCLDPTKDGCRAAQRHISCKPGQYINHTGTASTDTVCADCPDKTYSDGSLTSCQPHTQCKSLGLQELRPGTHWSNSECGPQSSRIEPGIIIGVVVASVLIAPIIIIIIIRRRRIIVILRKERSLTTVTFSPVTVNAVEASSDLEETPSNVVQ
ncbi:tumor necrosis factor receptor superfamily member 14-like isoform X1 [Oncorhynchus keta]|uniref:tumor necrosis factor receptor superfamily member 14-like isoform X1 n=1 Tax=Oncorhynchus keta TaxID=8018 RepID=UPI002279FDA9|nr:tumor necrosis factor receptor superfamily member 14-like isoform X1 [Oncorhynchus keta]XP_052340734.1 tumor necrosis factor receptor superfamily member 14-like isoform X1 [Oncorhynchus keta]XP_052340735.1 tumor necrosis factor receptor superfamily member 14-like isoform X1 [Oncorhynchus keta]